MLTALNKDANVPGRNIPHALLAFPGAGSEEQRRRMRRRQISASASVWHYFDAVKD